MNKALAFVGVSSLLLASCTQKDIPSLGGTNSVSGVSVTDTIKVDGLSIGSGTVTVQGENGTQLKISQDGMSAQDGNGNSTMVGADGSVMANGIAVSSGSVQMNGTSVQGGNVQTNGMSVQDGNVQMNRDVPAITPEEEKEINDSINSVMGDEADGVNIEKIK